MTALASLSTTVATGVMVGGVATCVFGAAQANAEVPEPTIVVDSVMNPDNANYSSLSDPNAVVALKSPNGWFKATTTIKADLVLYQWSINGADNNKTYIFEGDIYTPEDLDEYTPASRPEDKGNLHFFQTDARNCTIIFRGSMTEFSGDLTVHYTTGTLRLANNTGTGNVSMAGTLQINGGQIGEGNTQYINNATVTAGTLLLDSARATVFSGVVTANKTTLKNDGAITFGTTASNLGAVTLEKNATIAGGSYTMSALTAKAGNLTNGGNLTLGGNINLAAAITNTGTITFAADSKIDLTAFADTEGSFTIVNGGTVDMTALTKDNLVGVSTSGKAWTFGADGTISYVVTVDDLYYAGGTLSLAEGTEVTNGTFNEGDMLTFNTADANVTLTQSLNSEKLTIAEGVAVTVTGGNNKLTATELVLDGTLVLKDVSVVSSATTAGANGKLVLDAGAEKVWLIGDLPKTGTNAAQYAIDVESGVFRITGSAQQYGAFTVADGAGLICDGSTKNIGPVKIEGDGGWMFEGNEYKGALYSVTGATLHTTVELTDDASVGAVSGKTLTVQGKISGDYVLTKVDSGAVTLQGGSDCKEIVLNAGTLNLTGGVYNNSIIVNDGTLNLTGGEVTDEIVVNKGNLYWAKNQTSTAPLGCEKITLNAGAYFEIAHNASVNETDIVLNGARIYAEDQSPAGTEGSHDFGKLSVLADSSIEYNWNGALHFSSLSGNAKLTVDGGNEAGRTWFKSVKDYNGSVVTTDMGQHELVVGAVSQAAEMSMKVEGNVTLQDFSKLGAGSFEVSGTATLKGIIGMNYEGTLTLANIAVQSGTVLSYAGEGTLLSLSALDKNVVIDVLKIDAETLKTGVDLGIASTVDKSLISVLGLNAGEYTLDATGDTLKLTTSSAFHTEWDFNWGVNEIASAPATVPTFAVAADAGNVYVTNGVGSLTGGNTGAIVFGGILDAVRNGDTWIAAREGTYKLIVGGNYADNWGGSPAADFNGNSHIIVDGATVGTIMGGTYKDGRSPSFNGDSYISIFSGDVTASIIGAGTNAHMATTTFNGNTNIFVYIPLSTINTNGVGDRCPGDTILGAGSLAHNVNGTNIVNGNTNITVDLSGYEVKLTGDEKYISFKKNIVGGHYNWSDELTAAINGDTNVTIIGKEGVQFEGLILGGTRLNAIKGTISGTATINISGKSTYTTDIVGGMFHRYGGVTTELGSSVVNISGGTFKANVYGSTFLEEGNATITQGNATINISGKDTTIAGNLVGGMLIGNDDETALNKAELGNVTMTISGGSVNNVYGGSNVWRNHADSTVTQGAIALSISNATVGGDVYAAGVQNGSTKLSTTSTKITLGDGVVLTAGKTLSGGYGGAGTGSTITGATALNIDATKTVELTGVVVKDFDTLSVLGGTLAVHGETTFTDIGTLSMAAGAGLSLWDAEQADSANAQLTFGVVNNTDATALDLSAGKLGDLAVKVQEGSFESITLMTGLGSVSGLDGKTLASDVFSGLNGKNFSEYEDTYYVEYKEDGSLVLSAEKTATDFYWNGGDGTWSDTNWVHEGSTDEIDIADASRKAAVNAIFNLEETATINVGTAASVDSMTFEKGAYTFTGETLSVEGLLETKAGASATFSSAMEVGSLANAGDLTVEGALSVAGDATISAGAVEADSITVEGAYTQTGGDVLTSTLTVTGDVVISGGSIGTDTEAALELSGITIGNAGVSNVELADSTITGTLTNSSTLGLSGTITLGSGIMVENEQTIYSAGENGYKTTSGDYVVATGGTTTATEVKWVVDSAEVAADKAAFNNGTLTVTGTQGTIYYVRDGEVSDTTIGTEATGICLSAKESGEAELVLTTAPSIGISVEGTGNTIKLESMVLDSGSVTLVDGASVSLTGNGTYDLGTGSALADGMTLGSDWQGTVLTAGALTNGTDLSGMCLAGSTLELNGGLSFADSLDTLNVAGTLTLGDGFSLAVDDDLLATVADGTTMTLVQTGAGITGMIGNVATEGFTQSADGTMWQTENKNGYCYTITIDGNNITLSSQLAGIAWNSTDGVWSDEEGSDWKGGSEPGSDQDIALFAGDGTGDVTISGTVTPHGITVTPQEGSATTDYSFVGESADSAIASTDALNVLGGSASFDNLTGTFENSSKVAEGAKLNIGNGDAEDGTAKITLAELNNSGTTTIGADGQLTVSGDVTNAGTLSSEGNVQLGSLNNEGSLSATGETFYVTGDVTNSGDMQLGGDVSFGSLTTVADSSLELAEDGYLYVEGAVDNAGTMIAEGDVNLGDVTNSGDMQLSGASSELVSLNNSGTFELQGGELVISGAAANTGEMSIAGLVEAENMDNNGNISLNADGMLIVETLSGTGTTTLDGGSLALNSGADLSKLVLKSGSLVAEGALANGDLEVIGEELSITGTKYEDTTGLDVYGELNLSESGKIAGLSVYDNGVANFGAQPVAAFRVVSGQPSYATFIAGTEDLTMESTTSAAGITTVTITPTAGAKAAFNASNAIVKLGTTALTQSIELGAASTMTGGTLEFTLNLDAIGSQVFSGESLTLSGTEVILSEGSGTLANPGTGTVTLAGLNATVDSTGTVVLQGAALNKYYANARIEGGNIVADRNSSYISSLVKTTTANGAAGALLLDDAFVSINPQENAAANPNLAALMDAAEKGLVTDEMAAAVAGSSTATLGVALAGDVDRQLRAIRNRTTTMGVNQTIVNEGLPYVNAWVNAEGNHGELDKDGTAAGYTMDSWGGTIGFDVDVTSTLTVGMALTAMYGDLTADGPDMAEGDMDTLYLSAFARYAARSTTHTFVATIGRMDGSLERTVNYGTGSYSTKGDMDGMALGLMYEYGRVYKLTEDGDACWQPIVNVAWRSTFVSGYNESGSDAALRVDDQTMHTLTIGGGARMQAIVGENLYNRTSILELRALAKVDIGDTKSEVDVALLKGGKCAGIESSELGMFGLELGAGLSIPVGNVDNGTLFFDASAEIRDGYTNFNGTVGYRINF